MKESKNHREDITFIGSGISTSFTVLHLLEKIKTKKDHSFLNISIIDKYKEFNTGIPYGSRSGFSVLLITSLRNFLPEPELGYFLKWLKKNKEWLIEGFLKEGGQLSKEWVLNHTTKIKNNEWEDLFIPRRFFGHYINQKVKENIQNLANEGKVKVTYIIGNVIDIEHAKNTWTAILEDTSKVCSSKLVLSIGSLPTNTLWRDKDIVQDDNLLFINNPYKLELSKTLNKIREHVSNKKNQVSNVVIIGANASGLEMLYKMNDDDAISNGINSFTVLSTQGLLPDAVIDYEKLSFYSPNALKSLVKHDSLTAKEIADAAFKDLDNAKKIKLGAATTVGIVSSAFGSLLSKLNTRELKNFACYYGNEIGRRQRVAGLHYSNTVQTLKNEKRFQHIAGRFSNMKNINTQYFLEYLETATKKNRLMNKPIDIIVNCAGGMNLTMNKIPALLKNILLKEYIKANESNIGIEVNDELEASPDLHIIGPLLAGNVIENHAVWHVEHCGRIVALSEILAKKLIAPKISEQEITLNVLHLNKKADKNAYVDTIKKSWQNNPYYTFEYFSHHLEEHTDIIAFEAKKGTKSIAIMPMVKRKIVDSDFFDVISPYGYNGPLFRKNEKKSIKSEFWQLVDQWYMSNNILTEFVRFSLNENYINYSGNCNATLENVYGNLFYNFEKQWASFLPKVRNNYRKAETFKLSFKIFENSHITKYTIKEFYEIYVDTMKRNNAHKFLYFSLAYFEQLILSNPQHYAIATVYFKGMPISTELIIIYENIIHAFLGGTNVAHYNQRPNDFLRVEVIKWAIKKGKKNYVLGGGIRNNDGLYKSKKGLFPKALDFTYHTGKKIVNNTEYKKLIEKRGLKIQADSNNDFFPIYRQPTQ